MHINKVKYYTTFITALFFSVVCHSSIKTPDLTVYDIAKSSLPSIEFGEELIVYNDLVFFSASGHGLGFELWSFDIEKGELSLKQDINLGVDSSSPKNFVVYQSKLYFNAFTEENGSELWVYDKNTDSASLVADLSPGQDENDISYNSDPQQLVVFNNALYFLKMGENIFVRELWSFDGQSNDVLQAGDISLFGRNPDGGINIFKLAVFDQQLYLFDSVTDYRISGHFSAYTLNQSTNELTEIPITTLEKMLIEEYVLEDEQLFSTYQALTKYNLQTQAVTSFTPTLNGQTIKPANLTLSGENVIFSANAEDIGYELFSFNSSTLETVLLADISPNMGGYTFSNSSYPFSYVKYNQDILFFATDALHYIRDRRQRKSIWHLDSQTGEVVKLLPGSIPAPLSSKPEFKVIFDHQLYFTATDANNIAQLYRYDSELDEVITVSQFENVLTIRELTVLGEDLFFTLSETENNQSLWAFNKTNNSFTQLHSSGAQQALYGLHSLVALNNELYFLVEQPEQQAEIWSYQVAAGTVTQYTDFTANNAHVEHVTAYRNALYFTYKDEASDSQLWFLYSVDKNYGPVTTPQNKTFTSIEDLIVWDNKLYFTHQHDQSLSFYDNLTNRYSEDNIDMPIARDVFGEFYSNVTLELAFEDNLYFVDQHRFGLGKEPYYVSVTSQDYNLLGDLLPGYCCFSEPDWDWNDVYEGHNYGSEPTNFYAYDGVLYFNTDELSELWPDYDPSLFQSSLWHMPVTDDNSQKPLPISASSMYESFKDVSDIIAFDGALFATAEVTQNGIDYGHELIKLDINVTPKIIFNVPEQVIENKTVYLDASGSVDEDNDQLTYQWWQISGSSVEISQADENIASFTAPQHDAEPLYFELTASDGQKQDVGLVSILVNPNTAPTIELVNPITEVSEGNTHQFTASVYDAEQDDITIQWTQVTGLEVVLTPNHDGTVSIQFPLVNSDAIVELKATASDGNRQAYVDFAVKVLNVPVALSQPTDSDSKSGGVMNWLLLILLIFNLVNIKNRQRRKQST